MLLKLRIGGICMKSIAVAELVSASYILVSLFGQLTIHDKSVSMKRLRILTGSLVVLLVDDALTYIFYAPKTDNVAVHLIIYGMYLLAYVLTGIVLMLFAYYCEAYLNAKTKLKKWVFRVPILLLLVNLIIDVIYFSLGKLVVFENGRFIVIGIPPVFVLVGYVLLMCYSPVVAFIKRKDVGIKPCMILSSYGIPVIIAIVILVTTKKDLSLLAAAISMTFVVSFLQRDISRKRIEKDAATKALAENNARVLALEDKFESLYDVDLKTGAYEMYIKGKTFGSINSSLVNENDFFEDTKKNIRAVFPDDREMILQILRRENIHYALESENHSDWFYRLDVDGVPLWVKMRIVYKNDNKDHAIIGVFNAEDEVADKEEEEHQRIDLVKSKLRADALVFIAENEPDINRFMDFFGHRILEISGCDQVIFRSLTGKRTVLNAPGVIDVPQEICANCPFAEFDNDEIYGPDGFVLMNDCRVGFNGVHTHMGCPAKSSFMQRIYSDGKLAGLLTVHYLNDYHTFTDNGIDIMKTVARYLGLGLVRLDAKKTEIARLEAESANKAKTEFLFNMSHDIRTPMNAIIGFTNMAIREAMDPERVVQNLEKVRLSSDMLLSLINDILDMSRIESGKAALTEKPSDIRRIIDDIEPVMNSLASAKDINLSFDISKIVNYNVYVDVQRFERILVNIISNGIKYTEDNGHVRVTGEQESFSASGYGLYKFVIEDNGVGMSEEFQAKMFDEFSREESSVAGGIQGTGLGLSLAKKLVDMMNGSIQCESNRGVGTVFTITIPLRVRREFSDDKEDVKVEKPELSLKGKVVLLAEDNSLNREIATDMLEEAGMIVEIAEDGSEAVRIVTEHHSDYFDFILMDVQMPNMNGYEATAEIRKKVPDLTAPIIALSANAFEEDRQKSLMAGLNDHLSKPIRVEELKNMLARYCK